MSSQFIGIKTKLTQSVKIDIDVHSDSVSLMHLNAKNRWKHMDRAFFPLVDINAQPVSLNVGDKVHFLANNGEEVWVTLPELTNGKAALVFLISRTSLKGSKT